MVVNVSPPWVTPDTRPTPGTRGRAPGTEAGPSRPDCWKGKRRPASANARCTSKLALGPPSATHRTMSSQQLGRGLLRPSGPCPPPHPSTPPRPWRQQQAAVVADGRASMGRVGWFTPSIGNNRTHASRRGGGPLPGPGASRGNGGHSN